MSPSRSLDQETKFKARAILENEYQPEITAFLLCRICYCCDWLGLAKKGAVLRYYSAKWWRRAAVIMGNVCSPLLHNNPIQPTPRNHATKTQREGQNSVSPLSVFWNADGCKICNHWSSYPHRNQRRISFLETLPPRARLYRRGY